jgi:hypothetical protein
LLFVLVLAAFSHGANAQNLPLALGRRVPFGKAFPVTAPNTASTSSNASPVAAAQGPASASASAAQLVRVQKISEDVYEFNYTLTTGPGKYHQVGVHRVVRVPTPRVISTVTGPCTVLPYAG